jgi:MerR family transcriptional regulator, light-induced transcriptional regulator
MNAFTIKDIENLSGIKAHTIRIWEQRYSFLNPHRTDTNIRYYSNNELQTILNIALLNKYGYKISHINRMSAAEMNEKILSIAPVEAQQERLVNELIHCMIGLQIEEFEEKLNTYIHAKGIEKMIMQIIFPFLERIGILWMTNHINPAQEHLVSNVIRQKLIVGIDSIKSHYFSNQSAVLFLPEGEHHELALLFIHYLIKKKGVRVIYLGNNALKDIEYIARIKKPAFLYTHLTSVAPNFNFEKFLLNTNKELPGRTIIISGLLTQAYKKQLPKNVHFKKSLTEVLNYLDSAI